jgi:hypothetical protein
MAHLMQMEQRSMHYLPAQAGKAHATASSRGTISFASNHNRVKKDHD